MNKYIIGFENIRKSDVSVAGGKGANLGELTAAGLAVPGGFVVTTDSYRKFTAENKIDDFIAQAVKEAGSDDDKLREAAGKIREKFSSGVMPQEIKDAVLEEYKKLGKGEAVKVAVRSSATAEDLSDASFAGQQETYLNVEGEEELLVQVKNCYASLWGDRAVIYRANHNYGGADVALAVVIQLMVQSEKAGVMFTSDPITGSRDKIRINASYGLGESVVSGRVTADSYLCDKNGTIVSETIGEKKTQITGRTETAVAPDMQKVSCLSAEELKALAVQSDLIEKYYGIPMDIEWGIVDGKVYILQSRAITTLKDSTDNTAEVEEMLINYYVSQCHISGMARDNMKFLLEKISAPFYPLDYYMTGAINNQKSVIFREVGLEMYMQPQIDAIGITILPSDKKKIHKEIFKLGKTIKMLKDFDLCKKNAQSDMEKFSVELNSIKTADYSKMSVKEAVESFISIQEFVSRLAYSRFLYALFPSFFANKKITRILKKADPSLTIFDLYSNLDYRTALVSKGVSQIAEVIRSDDNMAKDILSGMKYEQAVSKYPELKKICESFLKDNGYKLDFNCYCLYSKSYLDDPDRVLNIVRPLVSSEPSPEDEKRFEKICSKIKDAYPSEKRYAQIIKMIDDIRTFHLIREESQYYWETAFYYARQSLKQISRLLWNTEDFTQNVAYLFLEEFKSLAECGTVPSELQVEIERRKGNRPFAEKVWERCKNLVFGEPSDVLKGISGSTGEASGPARVILSPAEFSKMQKGDVLVCQYTDPEWTPLFKLASAVVADTGAELSHAAIVAREYGIPAVLGVGYGTKKFHDGDMVYVNGTKGLAYEDNRTK